MNSFSLLFITFSSYHCTAHSITLTNIATSANGINYGRVVSKEFALREPFETAGSATASELILGYPTMTAGYPGPGLIDINNDDCIDIMVTNGPGEPHSLYLNNCDETFTDIAASAGVDEPDVDGSGVCFGDLDNDGYDDIVIAGRDAFNYIYMNNGDNTFTRSEGIVVPGQNETWGATCSLGDVNNDGYLDIFVGNAVRAVNSAWIFGDEAEPGANFFYNDHNELYINNGDGTYTDISETSGIRDTFLFPVPFNGNPTVTWANAFVDINQDGNIDIITADDQAAVSRSFVFGVDRGLVHILLGDGTGNFSDFPQIESGLYNAAGWMGLAFGDLNCDNELDVFVTNFGDYAVGNSNNPRVDPSELGIPFGAQQTREFYGQGSAIGSFYDPIHELREVGIPTPFGWGVAMFDIENDGDLDVVYYGGLENQANGLILDNPGMILINQGCDNLNERNRVQFERDTEAIEFDPNCITQADGFTPPQTCTRHSLRLVRGVATGDLNNDGFNDIVSLAVFSIVGTGNKLRESVVEYGNELDEVAFSVGIWNDSDANGIRYYQGDDFALGDLNIEINSGNDNNYVQILLVGGMGILDSNDYSILSNRNGIGALVRFYPLKRTRRDLYACRKLRHVEDYYDNMIFIPVTAGDSHSSQHALRKTFGLGKYRRGAVDITWPSGYKNVVYYLEKNEFVRIYEIPVSYDDCSNTLNDIFNIIEDVAYTYGMSNSEIRQYKRSFRLKYLWECRFSPNARAASGSHSNGAGNFIYLYIAISLIALIIAVVAGVYIYRKKTKQSFKMNQNNLEKEIQLDNIDDVTTATNSKPVSDDVL